MKGTAVEQFVKLQSFEEPVVVKDMQKLFSEEELVSFLTGQFIL